MVCCALLAAFFATVLAAWRRLAGSPPPRAVFAPVALRAAPGTEPAAPHVIAPVTVRPARRYLLAGALGLGLLAAGGELVAHQHDPGLHAAQPSIPGSCALPSSRSETDVDP